VTQRNATAITARLQSNTAFRFYFLLEEIFCDVLLNFYFILRQYEQFLFVFGFVN